MAFLIVTVSLSEETLLRVSIPRFCTIFPKCLLKTSTSSLSSEIPMILTKVVLSSFKVLSVNEGFTVFQNSLFWMVEFTLIVKLRFGLS